MKKALLTLAATSALIGASTSQAAIYISGVIDGDLSGGLPKAIVLFTDAAIADLAVYGVGSANNGGGTDGEEFTLSGTALANQYIIIADGTTSESFFTTNFAASNFVSFTSGSASINGDDAIELFQSGAVIDTYGDIAVDGNGEVWEYQDGYSVRTSGTGGAFLDTDWSFNNGALDTLTEAEQATSLGSAFNDFAVVPEPSTALLGAFGLLALLRRRR